MIRIGYQYGPRISQSVHPYMFAQKEDCGFCPSLLTLKVDLLMAIIAMITASVTCFNSHLGKCVDSD